MSNKAVRSVTFKSQPANRTDQVAACFRLQLMSPDPVTDLNALRVAHLREACPITHAEKSQEWFFCEIEKWNEVGRARAAGPVRRGGEKAART